ncbi:MAG: putative DNA-binding domain-containing protein, partial [Gemmobacter sp.]|uniref:HvfC/BufC N-terminal domain-containing protein n=1 Tax=Gemmobacter sp. TaxID=1898957 RepID=UPI001A5D2A6A
MAYTVSPSKTGETVTEYTHFPAQTGPRVTPCTLEAVGRRFDVYRNNVAHGLSRALAARFPVVERVVGAEFFAAMAQVFLKTGLPQSPLLLAWGQDFPAFLEGFPPLAGLPWLPDVARLELARGAAYHAADAAPLLPEALMAAAADAGAARLALHPSLTALASRWPVVTAWAMNQPGGAPAPLPAQKPEAALILRDRRDEVLVQEIGPGDLAFIAALQRGETLLQAAAEGLAAEPHHAPAGILTTLARAGALVGLSMGDDR